MLVSVAFAFLAASAAPASGNASASSAVSAPAVKEKKICRREEAVIGSLASKRTCKTKAEWDALSAQNGPSASDQRTTSPVRND